MAALTNEQRREKNALKQQAMKYFEENNVPIQIENIMNSMFYDKPPDVYGYLVNYFGQLTKPGTLNQISAIPVLDSNGLLTIQTDVYCMVNNVQKYMCSSIIPRADIRLHLEDQEKAQTLIQSSVEAAVNVINSKLKRTFAGIDPKAQEGIDAKVLAFIILKGEKDEAQLIQEMMNKEKDHSLHSIDDDKLFKKVTSRLKVYVNPREGKSAALHTLADRPLEAFTVGCELVAAISQAVCTCGAKSTNIPIYQHVASLAHQDNLSNEFRIPIPMVTVIQSGRSVSGKVTCIKEFMIVPGPKVSVDKGVVHIQHIFQHVSKTLCAKYGNLAKLVNETGALCPQLETVNQGLDILLEAVSAQELTIGEDIYLAINGAGNESFDFERSKYETVTGQYKSPEEMVDFWCDLITKYPSIVALIDPIRREDIDQWLNLCERVSERVLVIGDNFFERPGILCKMELPIQTSGIVMHIERMNTVSDIIACANKYQDLDNELVISTNNGDTTDTFIVDLAVGLNARFIKMGGPCRGEKTSKLNRLVQIKNEMVPSVEIEQVTPKKQSPDKQFTDKIIYKDDRKITKDEGSSRLVAETSHSKKKEQKDQTWVPEVQCYLKPHSHFTFPLIKNMQKDTQNEANGE